jgi:hypothetical protein
MCKCGCNTCETKIRGPLLTEGKVKSLLSEGLQYHINKQIPLFETVYRIGSEKHLALIKEARKMYSRNVIDLCEEDEALIGTHLGEFALYEQTSTVSKRRAGAELKQKLKGVRSDGFGKYDATIYGLDSDGKRVELKSLNDLNKFDKFELAEGESVPLDLPMLNEAKYDKEETIQQTIDRLKARIEDPNDGGNVPFLIQKIKDLEKLLNEAKVDYNFSKEELIRVIKQLKRGASTEIGMIKAFEKALGRELTDDEIRGFKLNEAELDEAEFRGKDVPLNKPKRGGSKAYYVYVRDPKTKKIKKVSFGSGGLRAKIKNKEARNAFAKRHRCKDKKDRTKAGYWSCNLPRYASALGLGANMNTFW